jgi:Zn-dependent protease
MALEPGMFVYRVKLFTLFGFQVWIDASWLLIGTLVAWTLAGIVFPAAVPALPALTYWSMAVAATIGLLFSIIFHETAHALVARQYGIEIRGITLFIFGGVAQMAAEPTSPRAEFLMALAGPVASLALSAGLLAVGVWVHSMDGPEAVAEVVVYLGWLNAMVGLFNLVPAYPLDGGRMLRAALWGRRDDIGWATRIAAKAGDAFGLFLIVFGVLEILRGDFIGGIWQSLIGMFLRAAAGAGYQQTMVQRLLADVSVAQVMTPQPVAVPADLSIDLFIEDYLYRFHHREFPVVQGGVLTGLIGTKQVAALDRSVWPYTVVSAIAARCLPEDVITPEAGALEAITRMAASGRSRLFVVRNEHLVGIVSQRDLMELLSVKLDLMSDAGSASTSRRATNKRAWA